MDKGLFSGTFYVLQKPVHVNEIPIHLNRVHSELTDEILATKRLRHLKHELGVIGDSIIWHKDHYELVEDANPMTYEPLHQHCN